MEIIGLLILVKEEIFLQVKENHSNNNGARQFSRCNIEKKKTQF